MTNIKKTNFSLYTKNKDYQIVDKSQFTFRKNLLSKYGNYLLSTSEDRKSYWTKNDQPLISLKDNGNGVHIKFFKFFSEKFEVEKEFSLDYGEVEYLRVILYKAEKEYSKRSAYYKTFQGKIPEEISSYICQDPDLKKDKISVTIKNATLQNPPISKTYVDIDLVALLKEQIVKKIKESLSKLNPWKIFKRD
jgi:hypothetical protein